MKGASRWLAGWLLVVASCGGGGGSGGGKPSLPAGTPSTVGLDYQYKTMVEDCALARGGGWHCGELALFTISRGEHLELAPWALRRACALGDFETCFKGVTAAGDTKRLELLTPELVDQACRKPSAFPEAECRQAFAVQVASATPKTPEQQAEADAQANRDYEAWVAREAEYARRPRNERLATARAQCATGNVESCDKVTFFERGGDPENEKGAFAIFRQREGMPSADHQRACRQWYEEELTRSIEPRLAKWAKRCANVRPSFDGDSEIQLPAPFAAHVAFQCRAVGESQYTRSVTRVYGGEVRTGTETVTVSAHTVCGAAGVSPSSHATSMAPVAAYCLRRDGLPPMSSQDEQRRKWFAGTGIVPGCSDRYLQR